MDSDDEWLPTSEIAGQLGVTAEWVRRQIVARRLAARRYETGERAFYRVRRADLDDFLARYATDFLTEKRA